MSGLHCPSSHSLDSLTAALTMWTMNGVFSVMGLGNALFNSRAFCVSFRRSEECERDVYATTDAVSVDPRLYENLKSSSTTTMERWCWWCKVSFCVFCLCLCTTNLSNHDTVALLSTPFAGNVRVFCHRSLHSSHCHVLSYLNIRTFLVMKSSMWCCEGHGLRRKGAVCQCSCCMFWTHNCESSSKIRIVGTTCRHKPIGSLNERNKNFVFLCFFSHWSVYYMQIR